MGGGRMLVSTFWVKSTMALTGIVFALFVLAHMLGNLKVLAGRAHFNAYAAWLRSALEPVVPHTGVLWIVRVVLLGCVVLHVVGAAILGVRARRARGPFRRRSLPLRTIAARTMFATGVLLLGFVIFHVLDLTLGIGPAASCAFRPDDAYGNLVASLRRPAVAIVYAGAMLALALHLGHGLWTVAHDLGATGSRSRRTALVGSGLFAVVVVAGNIGVAAAIALGLVR